MGIITSVTRWSGMWVLLTLSQGGVVCGYYYLCHKVEWYVGIINSVTRWSGMWVLLTLSQGGVVCGYY